MKKDTKTGLIIGFFILLLIGVFLVYHFTVQQTAFTSGCTQIKNPSDPSAIYTEVISAPTYTCTSDECIVWGQMTLDKSSSSIVCGECKSGTDWYNSIPVANRVECTPSGSSIKYWKSCSGGATYSGTFNFCPQGQTSYAYCSGSSNSVSSSSVVTKLTSETKITRGQSVSFNPKYSDNTEVTNKYIYIRKGDCSCISAISQGNACDPAITNKGLCQDTGYLRCDGTKTINTATCGDYKTFIACPTGQYCYSDANNKREVAYGGCKCPTDPCTLGEVEVNTLNTSQYRTCIMKGNCLGWSDYTNCASGLIFNTQTKSCVCDSSKSCTPGSSKCLSSTQYQECVSVKYGSVNCYIYSAAQSCQGQTKCTTAKCDCTGIDKCSTGQIKCIDSTHYSSCVKANSGSCYDFGGNTQTSGNTKCVTGSNGLGSLTDTNIVITGALSFGINKDVSGIIVKVSSTDASASKQIIARLCNGECTTATELSRITTYYNSAGEAILDFNYKSAKSTSLNLEVLVGDYPNGLYYKATSTINILKTLEIRPTCVPTQGYVGREIVCTWDIIDMEDSSLITGLPSVMLKQGSTDIAYSSSGYNGIKFTPTTVGNVDLTLKLDKTGYLSNTQTLSIAIQELSRSQSLLIDNKDVSSYSISGISTGVRTLEIKIEESGLPASVQRIDANIITPSAEVVTKNFIKSSEGNWKTTYDFVQAGQTYVIKGLIIYTDVSKPSTPFEYRVNTADSLTNDVFWLYVSIGVSIGVVVLVLIISIVFIIRRKRK